MVRRRFVKQSVIPVATIVALAACSFTTLQGTRWIGLSTGDQQAAPGRQPWISFGQSGELSGLGGCNDFSGSYQVEGD